MRIATERAHWLGIYVLLIVLLKGDCIRWLALRGSGLQWNASASCRRARADLGLARRQAKLCRTTVDAMPHVVKAAAQATTACQAVFADRRWNCTSIEGAPDFTADLTTGTREQAYVYALSSAAVVYTISRACAVGSLFHCACASPPRDPPNGNFKWGGCGDNSKWGSQFAKQFTDSGERRAMEGPEKRRQHKGEGAEKRGQHKLEQIVGIVRQQREDFIPGTQGHRLGYRKISQDVRPFHDESLPVALSKIDDRFASNTQDLFSAHIKDSRRRDKDGRTFGDTLDSEFERQTAGWGAGHKRRPDLRRGPEAAVTTPQERQKKRMKAMIAAVNLHNNRAGRRAVESSLVTQCKCHGVSGSCNIKTCWRALPRFPEIADRLKRRFSVATEVTSRRVGAGRKLLPASPVVGTYNQDDVIYVTKSPDYCMRNARVGSLGTKGRSCNSTSTGYDSCDEMCCGRGYRTVIVEKVERCQCKYYWCCYVKCKTCRRWVETHECN